MVTRFRFGSQTFAGTFQVNKITKAGNKIYLSAGSCVSDQYADGTINIVEQSIAYAASASPTVFHLSHALFFLLMGASIKITNITVFFSNTNTNTFINDFQFGNILLNPAMGINADWVDPDNYGTGATGAQNQKYENIDVILAENKIYAIQMDLTVGGGQTMTITGFLIEFDLV